MQFPIARAHMAIEAADLMRWKACWLYERGEPCGAEANMAKYLASEASWQAANACLDTHGGFGFAAEYDVERKFRETRLYQVAPVSNNLIQAYVGQHVLGHAAELLMDFEVLTELGARSAAGPWSTSAAATARSCSACARRAPTRSASTSTSSAPAPPTPTAAISRAAPRRCRSRTPRSTWRRSCAACTTSPTRTRRCANCGGSCATRVYVAEPLPRATSSS